MANDLASAIQADLVTLKNNSGVSGDGASVISTQPADAQQSQPLSFAQSMRDAITQVDDKERVALDKMNEVDSGRSDDLVGAMLSSQEASLSFSMLMQVRNKVMGAVDDLIKLPL